MKVKYGLVALIVIVAAILLIGWFSQSSPIIIQDSYDAASVYIELERDSVFLPGGCTGVRWDVGGIDSIFFNEEGTTGQNQETICISSDYTHQIRVQLIDGTSRLYPLSVPIVVQSSKFWIGVSVWLLIALVALWFSGIYTLLLRHPIPTSLTIITIGFTLWALAFILHTSVVAFDNHRYFSLFDDAMISMRYSWNLAHGNGLVWNRGEHVEGYTNLLMTLLMTPSNILFEKRFAVLSIQIGGIPILLLNAYLTMKTASHFFIDDNTSFPRLQRLLFFLLPLTYYPLLFFALMGMETGILTLWILTAILAASTDRPYLMGLSCGLAYITRPDSVIFIMPIMCYWLWKHRHLLAAWQMNRKLLTPIVLFLSFFVGQMIFRLAYYDSLTPNTYTLKVAGMPLLERLKNGVGFMIPFLDTVDIVILILCLSLLFRFSVEKLLIVSMFVISMFYQVYVGGDVWPLWRMMTPAMPLVFALFVHELFSLIANLIDSQHIQQYLKNSIQKAAITPLLACLVIGWAILTQTNSGFIEEMLLMRPAYNTQLNEENINTAIALNDITNNDATVGTWTSGVIRNYTTRPAVDFLGKMDPKIAALPPDVSGSVAWNGMSSVPGHNKYDLYYSIQELQPTYIQNCIWGLHNVCDWVDEHYQIVRYGSVTIRLKTDSPNVYWDKVEIIE